MYRKSNIKQQYGPIHNQNGYRIQTNDELFVMYRKSNIKQKYGPIRNQNGYRIQTNDEL
jgi:hypothetical protein